MDEGNHVLNMVRRFKKTPLKAEIIEAFVDVDTNSSSLISRSELRDGLQKKFNIDVTEEELDDVFHRMDVTGDDRLDIVEFCDFLTSEVDRLHQKHHLADNIDSESSSSYNPSELQTKPVARQESTSEAIKAKQLLQENSTVTPAYVPMSSDEGTDHQHHPSDVTVTPVYVPMNSEEGNHNQQQHDLVATPIYVPINSEEGNHNQQQHDLVATPVYVPMNSEGGNQNQQHDLVATPVYVPINSEEGNHNQQQHDLVATPVYIPINSEEGNHNQQQHDLVATPVYIPMDSEGGNQNQQQHAVDAKPIYQPMKSEVDKADKAYDEAVIASPKKNNVDDEPSKLSPSLHSPEVKGEHTVQPIASNKVSTILDDTNAEIPEAKNQKSTKVSAQPPPKSFNMGNSKVYPEQVLNFHIHIKHRMNPFRIFCITLCGLMLIFIVALSVSFVRLSRSDVTTGQHTIQPTIQPTDMPTSHSPTMTPTLAPTYFPTFAPTQPTSTPTDAPTDAPTDTPTDTPTNAPTPSTPAPTNAPTPPTPAPTPVPTNAPTPPTPAPTNAPTNAPTPPTPAPTNAPTPPTPAPTNAPTPPTPAPTHAPTQAPTNEQAPQF